MRTYCKYLLFLPFFFLLCIICKSDNPESQGRRWISPDKTRLLDLTRTDGSSNNPPGVSVDAESNGRTIAVTDSEFIASPIRREYAGTAWLHDISPRWVDNRYAVFEDPGHALCVMDVDTGKMLLNTTFESIADGPKGSDQWAAIRYRPTTRNQERLRGDEKDTLFIINLPSMATASRVIPEAKKKLFGHLKSTLLPGVALASPVWKADGSGTRVLVAVWDWNKRQAELLSFDPTNLTLLNSVNLNVAVPDAVVLSPWINKDFEPKIQGAITRGGL